MEDPKNRLLLSYLELIAFLRPAYVVLEQVGVQRR